MSKLISGVQIPALITEIYDPYEGHVSVSLVRVIDLEKVPYRHDVTRLANCCFKVREDAFKSMRLRVHTRVVITEYELQDGQEDMPGFYMYVKKLKLYERKHHPSFDFRGGIKFWYERGVFHPNCFPLMHEWSYIGERGCRNHRVSIY